MQYILSEEEFKELQARAKKADRFRINDEQLQELCIEIANNMPVRWGWGGDERKPWTCILTEGGHDWYCDQCPVSKICPHPHKEWSK